MGQREFVAKSNFAGYSNPNSLFYVHEDAKIKEDDPEIEEKYRYRIIFCESGSDVFEKYQSNEYKPTSKRINIFIEKENPEKSNFFGTAYAVSMGEERKELMQKLHENKGRISLENSIYEVKNLMSWCDELAILNKNIDKQLLYNAIILELEKTNPKNELDQLLDANSLISTLYFKGVEAIENWKLTEINYEYENYYLDKSYKKANNFSNEKPDFKPLIPIPAPHQMYENSKALGLNKILNLEYNFGEISFGLKDLAFGEYLEMVEEQFIANVTYLKQILLEKLGEKFGGLLAKIKGVLEDFIALFDKIKQLIKNESAEKLALLNAFLCGIINGLLSLLQSILWLLGVFVDYLPVYNLDEAYETFIKYNQEKLEFIEDLVDLISTNSKKIIEGIINIVTDSNTYKEIFKFVESLWKKGLGKLGAKSKYFWAYVIGALIFEIIVEIIIAFFTAGAGNAAKAAAKISKAIDKAKDALKNGVKVAKKTGKEVGENLSSLWQFLKKEFEELVEAIKSGDFIAWLKKKFANLTGDVLEEIVEYGVNELSLFALDYRKTLPNPKHSGNIAVFEYYDNNGNLLKKAFTTEQGRFDHAENIGLKWFEEQKIPLENVKTIYSELEPCGLGRHNCKKLIKDNFTKSNIEYSFPYPGSDSDINAMNIRRKSIKERVKLLKNLIK